MVRTCTASVGLNKEGGLADKIKADKICLAVTADGGGMAK